MHSQMPQGQTSSFPQALVHFIPASRTAVQKKKNQAKMAFPVPIFPVTISRHCGHIN